MGEGRGPARETLVHYGADELLIADGEIILPIQEGNQHTHPLSILLPNLMDVSRPWEWCIKGQPR
jgi:hypothetical protein